MPNEHVSALFRQFPQAKHLDEALRTATNPSPIFFAKRISSGDLRGGWYALVRLGDAFERRFNISGEVAIYFSPWEDLQRRAYNALTLNLHALIRSDQQDLNRTERFTPARDLILISTSASNAVRNLSAWNRDGRTPLVVAIPSDALPDELRDQLNRALVETLGERDLYDGKRPVIGDEFFGRREILTTLESSLLGGDSVAVFGLRRSGKTSLLLELRRVLASRDVVLSVTDLSPLSRIEDAATLVAEDLAIALDATRKTDKRIWVGDAAERSTPISTPTQLSSRLLRVAERNQQKRIVIALDEIESINQFAAADPAGTRALLGALRSVAQRAKNISLFFSGVATRLFSDAMLSSQVQNPVFRFVEPNYLLPFLENETQTLLEELGEQMLLEWEAEATHLVQNETAGFPYFVRTLASQARAAAIDDWVSISEPRKVTVDIVQKVLPAWTIDARAAWAQVVESMESVFEGTRDILGAPDTQQLNAWVETGPDQEAVAETLVRLGLLERHGSRLDYTATYRNMSNIRTVRSYQVDSFSGFDRIEKIKQLAASAESEHLEFKATARMNLHTRKQDQDLEWATVKTVAAFLNTDGGTLLIGIDDGGGVHGIEDDLKVTRSLDRYTAWLSGDLLGAAIGPEVIAQYVRLAAVSIDDRTVMMVEVRKSPSITFAERAGKEYVYVRNGNQTRELRPSEVLRLSQQRS